MPRRGILRLRHPAHRVDEIVPASELTMTPTPGGQVHHLAVSDVHADMATSVRDDQVTGLQVGVPVAWPAIMASLVRGRPTPTDW